MYNTRGRLAARELEQRQGREDPSNVMSGASAIPGSQASHPSMSLQDPWRMRTNLT